MDQFKKAWLITFTKSIVNNMRPPRESWTIPNFMINDKNTIPLEKFLGQSCWDIYKIMPQEEKNKAILYIETCGSEVANLLGIPTYETWDESPLKFCLDNLKIKYPDIHDLIIKDINKKTTVDLENLIYG
jgi:hypothetical protein